MKASLPLTKYGLEKSRVENILLPFHIPFRKFETVAGEILDNEAGYPWSKLTSFFK
jgi:hypothetical protein